MKKDVSFLSYEEVSRYMRNLKLNTMNTVLSEKYIYIFFYPLKIMEAFKYTENLHEHDNNWFGSIKSSSNK